MDRYTDEMAQIGKLLIYAGIGLVFILILASKPQSTPTQYDGSFNNSFNHTTTTTNTNVCVGYFPQGC